MAWLDVVDNRAGRRASHNSPHNRQHNSPQYLPRNIVHLSAPCARLLKLATAERRYSDGQQPSNQQHSQALLNYKIELHYFVQCLQGFNPLRLILCRYRPVILPNKTRGLGYFEGGRGAGHVPPHPLPVPYTTPTQFQENGPAKCLVLGGATCVEIQKPPSPLCRVCKVLVLVRRVCKLTVDLVMPLS